MITANYSHYNQYDNHVIGGDKCGNFEARIRFKVVPGQNQFCDDGKNTIVSVFSRLIYASWKIERLPPPIKTVFTFGQLENTVNSLFGQSHLHGQHP